LKQLNNYFNKKTVSIVALLIIIIMIGNLFSIWPIRFIESIVDLAQQGNVNNINLILIYGFIYLLFQLVGTFSKALCSYLSAYLQTDISIRIQNKLYSKLLKVSLIALHGENSVEITNSLIEDSEYVSNNLVSPITKLISSIVHFVIALIFMLNISPMLTLIILPCGLVTSLTARIISNKSEKNISEKRNKSSYLWKVFVEGIKGIIPIRLYRYQKNYNDIVINANNQIKKIILTQRKLTDLSYFLVSTLFMFTIGIIMIFSAIFVVNGYITIGSLTAVMMYNHMLVDPLIEILDIQQNLIKLKVSLGRINSLFSLPNDDNTDKNIVNVDKIILSNLSYTYGGNDYIFDKINIEISSPCNLCIMGESGSGKTTLANIIASLYTPSSGSVKYFNKGYEVDGIPNIGYLIQDGYLFDKSIIDNIKIANPKLKTEDIENIIKICCLEDVIDIHKNIPIGENGNHLSGGEKKRVRIAQMLANDKADVYIFDELTSSLDELTSNKITNNIFNLNLNKICIFIEHDKKMMKLFDKLMFVKDKNIIVNSNQV